MKFALLIQLELRQSRHARASPGNSSLRCGPYATTVALFRAKARLQAKKNDRRWPRAQRMLQVASHVLSVRQPASSVPQVPRRTSVRPSADGQCFDRDRPCPWLGARVKTWRGSEDGRTAPFLRCNLMARMASPVRACHAPAMSACPLLAALAKLGADVACLSIGRVSAVPGALLRREIEFSPFTA